jgi:CyaY protein
LRFKEIMDDLEFQRLVDRELRQLHRALIEAGDEHGFEADFNSGALTVEFDDPPGKFVVSPNAPVKQIWVSAHVKSFKLDWNETAQAFTLPTGQTLKQLMAECVTKQLGQTVDL